MSVTFRPGFRVLGSLSNMHNSPRNPLNGSQQAIQENLRFFSTKPASRVRSELMQIKFEVFDKSFMLNRREANRVVQELQASAGKASLQFNRVVACRSVTSNSDKGLCHTQDMVCSNTPLNSQQILAMTRYRKTIPNADWIKHMENCTRLGAHFKNDELRATLPESVSAHRKIAEGRLERSQEREKPSNPPNPGETNPHKFVFHRFRFFKL